MSSRGLHGGSVGFNHHGIPYLEVPNENSKKDFFYILTGVLLFESLKDLLHFDFQCCLVTLFKLIIPYLNCMDARVSAATAWLETSLPVEC